MARVYVAMPVMGGYYPQMVASLIQLLQRNPGGHDLRFVTLSNSSLISRGRNTLASRFLATDCDYFLSIDADLEFPVDALDRLIKADKDIVAAPYSTKETPPGWTVRFHEDRMPPYVEGLMPVCYVAAGFTLVKRRVFETLAKTVERYENMDEWFYNFYQPYVFEVTPGKPKYLGEDYALCQRAREQGFEVWCDFDLKLKHWGMTSYAMVEIGGKLPSNPMMPFAESLDQMSASAGAIAGLAGGNAAGEFGTLLSDMMASFQEVQGMLADLAVGKVPPTTPPAS